MMRLTLKFVNKVIKTRYPDLDLVKGKGYFYFVSDSSEALAYALAGLSTTMVLCWKLSDLDIDGWVAEADYVMAKVTKQAPDMAWPVSEEG
jgi:hypothetical protein